MTLSSLVVQETEDIFETLRSFAISHVADKIQSLLVRVKRYLKEDLYFVLPGSILDLNQNATQLYRSSQEMSAYCLGKLTQSILQYTPVNSHSLIGKKLSEVISRDLVISNKSKVLTSIPKDPTKDSQGKPCLLFRPPGQYLNEVGMIIDPTDKLTIFVNGQWKDFDEVKDMFLNEDLSLSKTPALQYSYDEEFIFD